MLLVIILLEFLLIAAIAMGAKIIEKHYLDRRMKEQIKKDHYPDAYNGCNIRIL